MCDAHGSTPWEKPTYFLNKHSLKRVHLPKPWKLTFNKVWWIDKWVNWICAFILLLGCFSFYTLRRKQKQREKYSLYTFKNHQSESSKVKTAITKEVLTLWKATGGRSCDYDKLWVLKHKPDFNSCKSYYSTYGNIL